MADEIVPETTETESEPEGVVEVQGQKVVPLAALTAERERVRTKTEERLRAEHAPVATKAAEADRLQAYIASIQPKIEYMERHPEAFRQEQAKVPDISDDEAEKTARDYELYTPTGLDLTRAKRIIAKNRAEVQAAAQNAAQEAVKPMMQTTAVHNARQNFVWAASQTDGDGNPLVDPEFLAGIWAEFPSELTAQPEVARTVLEAAIGRATRAGRRPKAQGREPIFTEPSGGPRGQQYQISDQERRFAKTSGMSEKQWADSAKNYQRDAINILGD